MGGAAASRRDPAPVASDQDLWARYGPGKGAKSDHKGNETGKGKEPCYWFYYEAGYYPGW